jgi:hypothetical protein
MRTLIFVVLLLPSACGPIDAPGSDLGLRDLAVSADQDIGICPAGGLTGGICNSTSGGHPCLYRDTHAVCAAFCRPFGVCRGTEVVPDQGTLDYVCVDNCNDCKPSSGGECVTE